MLWAEGISQERGGARGPVSALGASHGDSQWAWFFLGTAGSGRWVVGVGAARRIQGQGSQV